MSPANRNWHELGTIWATDSSLKSRTKMKSIVQIFALVGIKAICNSMNIMKEEKQKFILIVEYANHKELSIVYR